MPKDFCKTCDYKNAVRFGRCDWRCKDCGRQLMLELFLMFEAGALPNDFEPNRE